MIDVIWKLPIIYIALFIFFTFLKASSETLDKIIFCSVCASWLTALLIGISLAYPPIIISFMLGMTITGIAHQANEYSISKQVEFPAQFFLLQLLLTMAGIVLLSIFYT